MDAREQRIEDEIMATVDKIEGLKLKEREFGISEEKNAIDREQLGISRASQQAQQEYYEALAQAALNPSPAAATDQDDRVNAYVKSKRAGGDNRPEAVLQNEYFEQEASRAANAAADRLGITSEQQRQKLFTDMYEAAAKALPVTAIQLPANERDALIFEIMGRMRDEMSRTDGSTPTGASGTELSSEDQALIDRYAPKAP